MTSASPAGVLLWGGTGQARVLRPMVEEAGHAVVAVCDRDPAIPATFDDVRMLRDEPSFRAWLAARREPPRFLVAIGGSRGAERLAVADYLVGLGLFPLTVVHHRSWVAASATVGEGSQILAMACVAEGARVGRHVVVNTKASVDHDGVLGDGVHLMPGVTLAGEVHVGDAASVGAGATVLPGVTIGEGAIVGAGALVREDVPALTVVVGVPASPLRPVAALAASPSPWG